MNHFTRLAKHFRFVIVALSQPRSLRLSALFTLVILSAAALFLQTGRMNFTASAQSEAVAAGVNPQPFVTVSAASYKTEDMAPGSIVAGFGTQLATTTLAGADTDPQTPGIQLPKQLGGTTVRVGGLATELFYVSPGQINYVIPPTLSAGTWPVEVTAGDATISNGTVTFGQSFPSIFTADSSGGGAPAAQLLRVKTDGSQIYENVATFDATAGRFLLRPIDFGPAGERVFLVLFLSGVRTAPDPNKDGNVNESVRVVINGSVLVPDYAGPQGSFVGLDQINIELPRTLQSSNFLDLAVSILGGQSSNRVSLAVNTPPVTSLNWIASGLSGRALRGFTSIDNLLFSATNQGVFRSSDYGANWTAINTGLTNTDVLSIFAFGARLIAGTNGGGIFISTDNGATWTAGNGGLSGTTLTITSLYALGATLYLATPGGVCVSINGGVDWTALIGGLSGLNLNILNFAAIPNGGLYAATRGGVCVYNRTTKLWEAVIAGLPNGSYATTLTWNGTSLFAGTNGFGVYRFNGQTWGAANTGLPANALILSLLANGASLIAGTPGGGLYVSNNNGDTWTLLATGLGSADLNALYQYRGRLCAGTGSGVFGARLSVPASNRAPSAFAASLTTYANSGGQTVARLPITLLGSDADGDALIYLFTSPANGTLTGFAPNLVYTPNANFTGTDSFTFKVSDGTVDSNTATISLNVLAANRAPNLTVPGAQSVTAGQALNFTVAATDPDAGQTLTLTTGGLPSGATFAIQGNQGQLAWTPAANQTGTFTVNFIVSDNGAPALSITKSVTITVTAAASGTLTWTRISNGLPNNTPVAVAASGNTLFVTYSTIDGVYRSTDGGATWAEFTTGLPNKMTFGLVISGNDVFVAVPFGVNIYRTTLNGTSWTASANGITLTGNQFGGISSLYANGGTLYAGSFLGTLYRSTDNGANWASISKGLSSSSRINVILANGTTLFAGYTDNGGLYRSTDNGANWSLVTNRFPADAKITGLTQSGNTLFAAVLELDRVYRSTDNGATWVLVNNGLPTSNGGQAFSLLAVGNTVYVGFFLEGVYSTSDSGANWIPNRNGLPTQSTPWTLYADGTNLYAGIGFTTGISSGVYRATIAP